MISRRTAEIALLAIDAVLRRSRRNGGAVNSPDLERALRELHGAAADVSPGRQNLPEPVATSTLITVIEAARRLGVSTRTVERRVSAGQLRANRVGRNLQIVWHEEGTTMAAQPDATQAEAEAPARYRVIAPYVVVRTAGLGGFAGRSGYVMIGLYKHAVLPSDVPPEAVERHLREGMIEEIPA